MIPDEIKLWFTNYVDSFNPASTKAAEMIAHKRIHSHRVSDLCMAISSDLGWEEKDREIASVTGLLHDCGRFPQVVAHESYIDIQTFDHGEAGCKILAKSNVLARYSQIDIQAILDAVSHHNDHVIPDGLQERSLPFVRLIRDADKLDIFKILMATFTAPNQENREEYLLRKSVESRLSDNAVREVRNRQTVSHHNIETEADMVLMLMSWVYDISYLPTMQRIANEKYIDHLAALLPKSEDLTDIVEALKIIILNQQTLIKTI